jgi:adenylate cyclase
VVPPVTEPSHAVFLSYASQDAEAAQRISAALRAAGVEVWFDQSALRGGDVWDQTIRKQIKACVLFIPVISRHTHQRDEGYFRLEWKLAVDRSHLMATNKTFLLPVVIDDTREDDENVPDRFREIHWTRLPGGETPSTFVERVQRLVSPHPSTGSTTTLSAAAPVSAAALEVGARFSRPKRAAATLVAVIALASLAYFAVDEFAKQRALPPATAGTPAIEERSIAVLPFADLSEKHDQEFFADGMAEELLDLLSQVPDLRVPARTSSFYFKGRSDDITTIAQKLRVAHLLEGSVRRSGERIRVTAQLIRADNGYHLWSKTYDRVDKDVFEVQDEIASAVVSALKAQLIPTQPLASRHRTDSSEAYTEYLLGNQLRARDTPESNRRALDAYRRAVALDPQYAAAYAGISDAEWRVADMDTGESAAYQRSLEAAERAISLAPNSADGYWARGALRMSYDYDWTDAEADLRRALELDPNDVRAQLDYGFLLAAIGRTGEALDVMRKSVALDPLSTAAWFHLALLQIDVGQLPEARETASRLEAVNPEGWHTRSVVGHLALAEGRAADALTEFRKDDSGVQKLIGGAMAEYTLGHDAASRAALKELIRQHGSTLAYQIAEVYAWRGERDAAFAWLERAYRQRDGGMGYLHRDHFLASLRDDPRYRAMLKKLNLT